MFELIFPTDVHSPEEQLMYYITAQRIRGIPFSNLDEMANVESGIFRIYWDGGEQKYSAMQLLQALYGHEKRYVNPSPTVDHLIEDGLDYRVLMGSESGDDAIWRLAKLRDEWIERKRRKL